MSIGRFFAGVAALVRCRSDGKYLLLQRSAEKDVGGGAWECVTGRVDQGEGFADAARREIREELGVEAQIDFVVGTMHLYRGERKPENEMVGVEFRCSVADSAGIRTSAEHCAQRWATAQQADELLPADHWLRKLIQRAEDIRTLSPPELLQCYLDSGFEL